MGSHCNKSKSGLNLNLMVPVLTTYSATHTAISFVILTTILSPLFFTTPADITTLSITTT